MDATMTDFFRAQFELGQLDRTAGLAIQTREQHKESFEMFFGADAVDDLYRAYRNGYNHH